MRLLFLHVHDMIKRWKNGKGMWNNMRMRAKKWARPELAVCPYYVKEPQEYKGKWDTAFSKKQPLHVELGCGKGRFLAQAGIYNPQVNFLGIDLISDMLGVARRTIESAYAQVERPVDNILLASMEITRIDMDFSDAPADQAERIYINFCNPWFKPSQHKKRLTHPRQLEKYRMFLKDGGEIWFKTDDDLLFHHSIGYFELMGFSIRYLTYDLHTSGFSPNYRTEHEEMYTAQGIKTKFLIAVKEPGEYLAPKREKTLETAENKA